MWRQGHAFRGVGWRFVVSGVRPSAVRGRRGGSWPRRGVGAPAAWSFAAFRERECVVAALIHPLFMAGLAYSLIAAPPLQAIGSIHAAPMFGATLLSGYASTIALDLIRLMRRNHLVRHAWGAGSDADLLVLAVARRVARIVAAALRFTALGEDRAWAGAQFAPGAAMNCRKSRSRELSPLRDNA